MDTSDEFDASITALQALISNIYDVHSEAYRTNTGYISEHSGVLFGDDELIALWQEVPSDSFTEDCWEGVLMICRSGEHDREEAIQGLLGYLNELFPEAGEENEGASTPPLH